MRLGPFKRGFGPIPIGFKRVQAILQNVVHFGYAIFDQLMKVLQLLIGISGFPLKRRDAPVYGVGLSARRNDSEDKIMARRSGCNSRSVTWVVTRVSSFAIGIERFLQTVLPFRAQVEQA